MRQAPPVGVTCTGRGAWRVTGALLAAAAAGVVVAWLAGHAGLDVSLLTLAAVAAAGTAGAASWRHGVSAPRTLRWDGGRWSLDDRDGRAAVVLDLGNWMLLRFDTDGTRTAWLPVGATEAGAAWHPLRCAVHAAPSEAPIGEAA